MPPMVMNITAVISANRQNTMDAPTISMSTFFVL